MTMIAEADLDAVDHRGADDAHLELTLAAVERGIAVLVEKPLTAP